jgi:hypothetical protein
MSAGPESQCCHYIYAIVPASGQKAFDFAGLDGAPLYTIAIGRVAAVVSDLPNCVSHPERRYLAAQEAVFQGLMAATDAVLPLTFGSIAASPQAIQRLLAWHQEDLLKQLLRVAGMVEMGLRVSWNVPDIFAYFLLTHPELQAARERLSGSPGRPSLQDSLELRRLFDRLRQEERETYTAKVIEVLSGYCRELQRGPCRRETEVMNLACLVRRQALDRFAEAVSAATRLFDNHYAVDYHGPWAPQSFAQLEFQLQSQAPPAGAALAYD